MVAIDEKDVKSAIMETQAIVATREEAINSFLDHIIDVTSDLQTLISSYKQTIDIVLKYSIQTNAEAPNEEILILLRETNKANFKFLTFMKNSRLYVGVKSAVKELETSTRDFQELYDDYAMRFNTDQELIDLMNEAF
jgi:hypothetical protein